MDMSERPVPGREILVRPNVGIAFATWRVLSLAGRSTQIRRSERSPFIGSKQRTSWKFFGLCRRVGDNGLVCDAGDEWSEAAGGVEDNRLPQAVAGGKRLIGVVDSVDLINVNETGTSGRSSGGFLNS